MTTTTSPVCDCRNRPHIVCVDCSRCTWCQGSCACGPCEGNRKDCDCVDLPTPEPPRGGLCERCDADRFWWCTSSQEGSR